MADLFIRKDCSEAFAPTSEHLKHSFRELAHELSAMGAAIDVPIRPYVLSSLPHFGALSLAEQQEAVMKLAQYVSICQDVVASGGSLRSTRTFVWRAFRTFGWTPNSKFFETMSEDHVVEIYDLNNIQIFRNFKFFEFCSYTLEDIFTRPWMQLFQRKSQSQTDRLLAFVARLLQSRTHDTVFPDVGVQNTREVDSELRYKVDLEVESMALLFDSNDEPTAFIACEHAKFSEMSH